MGKQKKSKKIRISGEEFERLVAQEYYEKFKDEAIIEPNLILFEDITPSTVDFKAEFDLFANFKNGSTHIIECKARPIDSYDINRLHIQAKRAGNLNSLCKLLSAYDFEEKVKQTALNLGIQVEKKNLYESAEKLGMRLRDYINLKIRESEMYTYYKYNKAALYEFPGYYILLNNCWITNYSEQKEIIHAVKDAMKLSIPHAYTDERKVMEFLFIKACLLEKWLVNNDKTILTQDVIKLILNTSYNDNTRHKNLQAFLKDIKSALNNKVTLTIDKNFRNKRYKAKFIEYIGEPEKFSDLYIVMGFDRYILPFLSTLINNMWKKYQFKKINLIHTSVEGSIEATNRLI